MEPKGPPPNVVTKQFRKDGTTCPDIPNAEGPGKLSMGLARGELILPSNTIANAFKAVLYVVAQLPGPALGVKGSRH